MQVQFWLWRWGVFPQDLVKSASDFTGMRWEFAGVFCSPRSKGLSIMLTSVHGRLAPVMFARWHAITVIFEYARLNLSLQPPLCAHTIANAAVHCLCSLSKLRIASQSRQARVYHACRPSPSTNVSWAAVWIVFLLEVIQVHPRCHC